MTAQDKKTTYQIVCLVAASKLVRKAMEVLKEENAPAQYLFYAQGTASSEIMDLMGFGGVEKGVLQTVMPKPQAERTLRKLKNRLYLGMPNTGIAFTIPLSGGSGRMIQLIDAAMPQEKMQVGQELIQMVQKKLRTELGKDGAEMAETEYSLILTIANQGYSEQVMDAARAVGASGGTVFHSRRVGSEEAMRFWGISIQQEREIVLILAERTMKKTIMQAIGEKCGMNSEAHGVVISLPVDAVAGLN